MGGLGGSKMQTKEPSNRQDGRNRCWGMGGINAFCAVEKVDGSVQTVFLILFETGKYKD